MWENGVARVSGGGKLGETFSFVSEEGDAVGAWVGRWVVVVGGAAADAGAEAAEAAGEEAAGEAGADSDGREGNPHCKNTQEK